METHRKIFVMSSYEDSEAIAELRERIQDYKSEDSQQADRKKGKGQRRLLIDINNMVSAAAHRIYVDTTPPQKWEHPEPPDGQWIDRFLAGTNLPSTARLQLLDAFIRLHQEQLNKNAQSRDTPEFVADALAKFLGDSRLDSRPNEREQIREGLIGYFEYKNVDNIGGSDETTRVLKLYPGQRSGYLLAVDLAPIQGRGRVPTRKFVGFCIPRPKFSPIVMRALGVAESINGLLYTPSSFLNIKSPSLNELRFDILTDSHPFFAPSREDRSDNAVSQIRQFQRGPRVTRILNKLINEDSIVELEAQFR